MKIVSASGIEAATVRAIAVAARVSPGRIIQQFGTKDQLLAEIFASRRSEVSVQLGARLRTASTIRDLGRILAQVLFQHEFIQLDLARHYYSYAWKWPQAEEARFVEEFSNWAAMLSTEIARLCKRQATDDDLAASEALMIVYAGVLRLTIMHGLTLEQATVRAERDMAAILRGIETAR